MPTSEPLGKDIVVRTLREADLPAADRIFRLAFGTFLGLPDPIEFHGDADFARTRWIADPSATFGADLGGNLVASNFATRWGSVGFFGPLTVRPDLWDRGVAKRLIEATMELFASGVCYVKFAAVRPRPTADHIFGMLLDSCERFAELRQLPRLVAGVNAGRERAYRHMMAYGFRTDFLGVAMQRHNDPGYNRSEVYVIDDWR